MSYLLVPDARAVLLPPERGLVTPSAQWYDVDGQRYVAVPHDLESTAALRGLGIAVPSPIGYYYNWPKVEGLHDPMSHQRDTAAFATLNPRCYILNDLGTGKTHSTLWAADYMMNLGVVERALIVCPLSTMRRVWGDAIYYTFGHHKFQILHGSSQRRRQLFDKDASFYIINHDGFDIIRPALMERRDINLMMLDELSVYRHRTTSRTKLMKRSVRPTQRVWGITGAPRPNAPTDVYAQCEIVTPNTVKDSFRMLQFKTMEQHSATFWTERPHANKVIFEYMSPAIRFTRDQCLDLPEYTYSVRETKLSTEQATAYKQMAKELAVQVKGGLITAANAGVKAGKLLQISGGAIYDGERVVHEFDCTPRLNELHEIRNEIAVGKIIVFASFRHTVERIAREMRKKYGDSSVAVIHGGVSPTQRDAIFSAFQKQEKPTWLIADPGTMSHGLTLTEAGTIVWWGPEASNDVYGQANMRIIRIGQKHAAHIIHLQSSPAERRLFKICGERSANQNDYLSMIEDAMVDLL